MVERTEVRRLCTSTSRGGRRDGGKQDRAEEMTEGGEGERGRGGRERWGGTEERMERGEGGGREGEDEDEDEIG